MSDLQPFYDDVQAHYDLSDEFFRLFLDPTQTYCGQARSTATKVAMIVTHSLTRAASTSTGIPASDAVADSASIDPAPFTDLVREHRPALLSFARRTLTDDGDAADAVQDTFVAAWTRPTFRGEATVSTWLHGICAHKIIDIQRARRTVLFDANSVDIVDPDRSRDPFVRACQAGFLTDLTAALSSLPTRQRAAWLLRECENRSYRQIGAMLGVSAEAARGQHRRVTTTLARRLRPWA